MKGIQITSETGIITRELASQYKDQEFVSVAFGTTEIASLAFADCRHLKGIYLPATINKIGNLAFPAECKVLIHPFNESFEVRFDEYIFEIEGKTLVSLTRQINPNSRSFSPKGEISNIRPFVFNYYPNVEFLYFKCMAYDTWDVLRENIHQGSQRYSKSRNRNAYLPVYNGTEETMFFPVSGLEIHVPSCIPIDYIEINDHYLKPESVDGILSFLHWCHDNGIDRITARRQQEASYTRNAGVYHSRLSKPYLLDIFHPSLKIGNLIRHFHTLAGKNPVNPVRYDDINNLLCNVPFHYITVLDCATRKKIVNVFTGEEIDYCIRPINQVGLDGQALSKNHPGPRIIGAECDEEILGKAPRIINPDLLGYYDSCNGNIFIFIDKLYLMDDVLIFQKVVLHEFIHALFDRMSRIADFSEYSDKTLSDRLKRNGYDWDEETLDNLLVLLTYYDSGCDADVTEPYAYRKVREFIASQPFYYSQAINFFDGIKEDNLRWEDVVLLMRHHMAIKAQNRKSTK